MPPPETPPFNHHWEFVCTVSDNPQAINQTRTTFEQPPLNQDEQHQAQSKLYELCELLDFREAAAAHPTAARIENLYELVGGLYFSSHLCALLNFPGIKTKAECPLSMTISTAAIKIEPYFQALLADIEATLGCKFAVFKVLVENSPKQKSSP